LEGRRRPYATKKRYGLIGEKRDEDFYLRVFRYAPDRTVFSAAVTNIEIFYSLGFMEKSSNFPTFFAKRAIFLPDRSMTSLEISTNKDRCSSLQNM
jgi:hypothetical protein